METSAESGKDYIGTLLQLGQTLNSSLDLSQVLHTAIEQVVKFVNAERGFILLVEEGSRRVWGKATHGIDPLELESALSSREKSNSPEISRTIVERALQEREHILSMNAMEDSRFAKHTSVRLANLRSVLCVPLIAQGKVIGIVYLDNRVKDDVFHERQLEMLTAFANQAAVAIQNARLYDNLKKSVEERLRLQSELHEKETQRLALEEANRLKSDYIGFVTHELRNPLTTIRGFIQTLELDDTLSRSEQLEFYETIEAECDRMLEMINELLDSSRLEAGRPITLNARMLDLTPLLERICRFQRFYRFWTPAHTLKLEIEPGLPAIEADEDKLHQILSNLLSNAIKYSPEGGEILVRAYSVENGVHIEVRDNGIGMTQEQISKLFTPYERLEREEIRAIPGTGLGLFLTRHLVELHGGRITCQSEPGKGSLFTLFLPRHTPSA